MKRKISVFGAIFLVGCVSSEQMQKIYDTQVPLTGAQRSAAVAYIKSNFYDPYSIRDATISNAVTLGDTGLKAVCVRFNAKNRMGGYVGLTYNSLRFRGDVVESSLQDAPSCGDARLKFQPFPEVEHL